MYCHLVVGGPRQGKSNYAKAIICCNENKNKPCYVYDPKNEYGPSYTTLIDNKRVVVPGPGLPANNPRLMRSRYTGDHNGISADYFFFIVSQKRGCIVEIDECTSVLKGQISKEQNEAFTGRFHTNNSFVLIFHSLETIPPDLIRNSSCDQIILFKTLDSLAGIKAKFNNPLLNAGFEMQRRKPNKSAPTIINLTEGLINNKEFIPQ